MRILAHSWKPKPYNRTCEMARRLRQRAAIERRKGRPRWLYRRDLKRGVA